MIVDYSAALLRNVHEGLTAPTESDSVLVKGTYEYWHYGCDGFNDKGWGCGYRTLQTICSWIKFNKHPHKDVPSIRTIQATLVNLEDKEDAFLGSREWIGSFEVCLVVDETFGIPSRIIHVPAGKDLPKHVETLRRHFAEFGSPIMMGGDRDCSSKCIVGVNTGSQGTYLLIVDPHFVGKAKSPAQLQNDHWVKWHNVQDFMDSSFYNLCLPQVKYAKASGHE